MTRSLMHGGVHNPRVSISPHAQSKRYCESSIQDMPTPRKNAMNFDCRLATTKIARLNPARLCLQTPSISQPSIRPELHPLCMMSLLKPEYPGTQPSESSLKTAYFARKQSQSRLFLRSKGRRLPQPSSFQRTLQIA